MPMREWADRVADKRDRWVKIEFTVIGALVVFSLILAVASVVWPVAAAAHPGGLAADGCHNDRKNGGRPAATTSVGSGDRPLRQLRSGTSCRRCARATR